MIDIINTIVVGAVLATGCIIGIWGLKKRSNTKMAMGVAILLFGLFVLLDRMPKYADTFNAWATLLLALAAAIAISVTIDLDRRRRLEQKVSNDRERKEYLLNKITEWATNVLLLCSPYTIEEDEGRKCNEYIKLKLSGESLNILAANAKFDECLLTPLNNAKKWFDENEPVVLMIEGNEPSDLMEYCKTIREKALNLLKI